MHVLSTVYNVARARKIRVAFLATSVDAVMGNSQIREAAPKAGKGK